MGDNIHAQITARSRHRFGRPHRPRRHARVEERGHFVRGFDLVATPGADESVVSDLADADAIHRAAEGVNALIHLAATPDDDDFLTKLLPNNIVGAYHVLEAARLADVTGLCWRAAGKSFGIGASPDRCPFAPTCSRRRMAGMRLPKSFRKRPAAPSPTPTNAA